MDTLETITKGVRIPNSSSGGLGIYGLVLLAALSGGCAGTGKKGLEEAGTKLGQGIAEAGKEIADHLKDIIGIVKLYEDNVNLREEVQRLRAQGKVKFPVTPCNADISLMVIGSSPNLSISAYIVDSSGQRNRVYEGIFPNTVDFGIPKEEYAAKLATTAILPSISAHLPREGTYTIEVQIDTSYGHGAYSVAIVIEDPNTKERMLTSAITNRSDRGSKTFSLPLTVGLPIGNASEPMAGKTDEQKLIDIFTQYKEMERQAIAYENGICDQWHNVDEANAKLKEWLRNDAYWKKKRSEAEGRIGQMQSELATFRGNTLDFVERHHDIPELQQLHINFVAAHQYFGNRTAKIYNCGRQ